MVAFLLAENTYTFFVMWVLRNLPYYQQSISWVPQLPTRRPAWSTVNTVIYGVIPSVFLVFLVVFVLVDSVFFRRTFWQRRRLAIQRCLSRCRAAGTFCLGVRRHRDRHHSKRGGQAFRESPERPDNSAVEIGYVDHRTTLETSTAEPDDNAKRITLEKAGSSRASTCADLIRILDYAASKYEACQICHERPDCPVKHWKYLSRLQSACKVYALFALPLGVFCLCFTTIIATLPTYFERDSTSSEEDHVLYILKSLVAEWAIALYLFSHAAVAGCLLWKTSAHMNHCSVDGSIQKTRRFSWYILGFAVAFGIAHLGCVIESVAHWVFLASYDGSIPLSTLWKPAGVFLWLLFVGTALYIGGLLLQFTKSQRPGSHTSSSSIRAERRDDYETGVVPGEPEYRGVGQDGDPSCGGTPGHSPHSTTTKRYAEKTEAFGSSTAGGTESRGSQDQGCGCTCCTARPSPSQLTRDTPETTAGWFSRVIFSWVRPLLTLGCSRPLEFEDLFYVPTKLKTLVAEENLRRHWKVEEENHQQHKKASLVRACWRWMKSVILATGALKFLFDTLNFTGPILLNYFIRFLERTYASLYSSTESLSTHRLGGLFVEGSAIVLVMCASNSLQTVLLQQYFYFQFTVGIRLRAAITGVIYSKALRTTSEGIQLPEDQPASSEDPVEKTRFHEECRRSSACASTVTLGDEELLKPVASDAAYSRDPFLASNATTERRPSEVSGARRSTDWTVDPAASLEKRPAGTAPTSLDTTAQPKRAPQGIDLVSSGKIVNLMSVDAQRLLDCMPYIHILWSGPYQIILALVLLWYQLGPSMLTGVGIMCASVPASALLARALKRAQERLMLLRDERIKVTNEALSGIKIIKLYAWEKSFEQKITSLRETELKGLWKYTVIATVQKILWNGIPVLVSFMTFLVYVAVGNELTAAKAFTAIALFQNLRFPLGAFPNVVSLVTEANVACKRIQTFLLGHEIPELPPPPPYPMTNPKVPTIVAKNLSVSWAGGIPLLRNATFCCYPGTITAIVGVTGVGKTGLLSCLIGDLPPDPPSEPEASSKPLRVEGRIAYVAQTAWIQNCSLRENVLFGRPYEEGWYYEVLEACALLDDLRVLPSGDLTEIGEKGVNLSGGQKQRVALARAVYQSRESVASGNDEFPRDLPADIYILDDCLSAVDAHVGQHIFQRCIQRLLRASQRTVVLVTHKVSILPQVDQVLLLARPQSDTQENVPGGTPGAVATPARIVAAGTHEELSRLDLPLYKSLTQEDAVTPTSITGKDAADAAYFVDHPMETNHDDPLGSVVTVDSGGTLVAVRAVEPLSQEREAEDVLVAETATKKSGLSDSEAYTRPAGVATAAGILTEKENVEMGAVGARVYLAYFNGIGGPAVVAVVLVAFALSQGAQVGGNLWLSHWSTHVDTVSGLPTGIGIYATFGAAQILFFGLVAFTIGLTSLWASRFFHRTLLQSLLRAPMAFFDSTPLGRIMNRFSKDLYTIDQTLPSTISMYILQVFTVAATFLVICIATPWFIAVCVPLCFLYMSIQHYYIPTSRQLQRLDSTLKSPVFAHFSETLCGVSTIRAFRCQSRFKAANAEKLDYQQRAYYLLVTTNRWLAVRLEFLGTLVVLFSTLFVLMGGLNGTITTGLAGVMVSYALSITQSLNWLVRMASDRESNIVSVERVEEYSQRIPQEARDPDEFASSLPSARAHRDAVPPTWPHEGSIRLVSCCLRYRPGLPLVLSNVTLEIKPREKVGVVGRTGAGKSSMLLALMRLVELTEGSIFVDQVDISSVPLTTLRSRFSIIPQDPVLFTGSLRFNVDPFDTYSDDAVWSSLQRAHLGHFVSHEFVGGIHGMVEENGGNLSQGQRQLLCLARALLRKSTVLLLDEATSAVDPVTDRLIQQTIRQEFKNSTILTIAHRLGTIMDYDKILVLDRGCVVEFDSPSALLNPALFPDGYFRALCAKGGIEVQ